MSHFIKFDHNNDEFPSQKYPSQHWYGKKEIPNILLTLSNSFPECKDYEEHKIYLDILTQYYEEYDTITGWKVVMEMPLMSPKVYELLTKQKYTRYHTQADNFWRSADTGKDEGFLEPELHFNSMRIEHKLQCEGDPAKWYITLWNEKEQIRYKEPVTLKEVEL